GAGGRATKSDSLGREVSVEKRTCFGVLDFGVLVRNMEGVGGLGVTPCKAIPARTTRARRGVPDVGLSSSRDNLDPDAGLGGDGGAGDPQSINGVVRGLATQKDDPSLFLGLPRPLLTGDTLSFFPAGDLPLDLLLVLYGLPEADFTFAGVLRGFLGVPLLFLRTGEVSSAPFRGTVVVVASVPEWSGRACASATESVLIRSKDFCRLPDVLARTIRGVVCFCLVGDERDPCCEKARGSGDEETDMFSSEAMLPGSEFQKAVQESFPEWPTGRIGVAVSAALLTILTLYSELSTSDAQLLAKRSAKSKGQLTGDWRMTRVSPTPQAIEKSGPQKVLGRQWRGQIARDQHGGTDTLPLCILFDIFVSEEEFHHHDIGSMTTHELFRPPPEQQGPAMAANPPVRSLPPAIVRSSSDSVVIASEKISEQGKMVKDLSARHARQLDPNLEREDIALQTNSQGTLLVAARAVPTSKTGALSTKARQQLQLPSFKALGIAVPYPTSIITPPDEPTSIDWTSPTMGQSSSTPTPKASASSNYQAGTMPGTMPPSPDPPAAAHQTSSDTPTQGSGPAMATSTSQSANADEGGPLNEDSGSVAEIASNTPLWLEKAIQAILPEISMDERASAVINVIAHSQPCPVSTSHPDVPNALKGIVEALQAKFERYSVDKYVEVTHAVPPRFNFSELPSSPVTTPNRPATQNMDDYFSMPKTVVYSKAAVVCTHAEITQAQNTNASVRGIAQTAVAPSSVALSVLERFIPPVSSQEYQDLFRLGQPSALVDRLTELKPDCGSLVFVYPTRKGASTFDQKYLQPILDPQLRLINQVNSAPSRMVESIARLEAVKTMKDFDGLKRMISGLLAAMNGKGHGNVQRFDLVTASKQTVRVGRKAWAAWYLKQEVPRIRKIIDDYYARTHLGAGSRDPGSPAFASGGFVREIQNTIDPVSSSSSSSQQPPPSPESIPSEGIEVGVFVIKRSK
ncbi:MAG: hypothetical protein Q9174_002589, partial [Haloplaca sp. 1 TL-2023]